MVKAVIFDVDGTLVDTVDLHAQAWQKAFAKYGYEISLAELRQQIGKGSEYIIPVFISQAEFEEKGEDIAEYRKEYFQNELMSQVRPFEKVPELFKRIKADSKKVVLATSARKTTLETYKKLLKIDDLADGATAKDDVEKSKPEPDIFAAALAKLSGISAEEVIVVGDSPYDAIAAGKINLRTVGVLCGGFSEEVLREAGCIAIYQSPADLLANYVESPLAEN
ncbi:MAG: HAD family hydrolase [Kamptonema sp. SIO1D9]|nr:HAD family hydrolase [Kamptonema sp. SIO1D9]